MASSTATLRHTILVISFIAGATAQQQQGGVSWETAPECPDSGSGTAVDTEGRSWGWYNGQSCKHSRSSPQNAALTAAQQQQQQSWDAAPPCTYQLTADNGRADAQGRLWGWQDGRSCRHTGSIGSSPPITPSSPSPPPSPALAWEAAPPCSYQATVANSRVDALGRYWGWQTGVGSCRFDQPPKVTPPPSPSPPAASPDPASPAPLRAPVPPSPVPTKQQPVPTVPGKTVGTSPAPGEEVIPVPAVEGEWHVGHLVAVHGFENFSGSNPVGCGANTVRNDAVQHTAVQCRAAQCIPMCALQCRTTARQRAVHDSSSKRTSQAAAHCRQQQQLPCSAFSTVQRSTAKYRAAQHISGSAVKCLQYDTSQRRVVQCSFEQHTLLPSL
jgi:hypothetical protein